MKSHDCKIRFKHMRSKDEVVVLMQPFLVNRSKTMPLNSCDASLLLRRERNPDCLFIHIGFTDFAPLSTSIGHNNQRHKVPQVRGSVQVTLSVKGQRQLERNLREVTPKIKFSFLRFHRRAKKTEVRLFVNSATLINENSARGRWNSRWLVFWKQCLQRNYEPMFRPTDIKVFIIVFRF